MRRVRAIAFATVLELLGDPLCLLIALSAMVLSALSPAFHYHQFGEPSRMSRDAGFSALLLGGLFHAAFGAHKTLRREIESGTMQTALAHSVSRSRFFLAKFVGCACAYGIFALTVGAVSLIVVNGAEIGGRMAAVRCDVARVWGPSLSLALLAPVGAIVVAAALNRFAHFRFSLTTSILACVLALAGLVYRPDGALFLRLFPAMILFSMPPLVLLAASAAFAVRFRSNLAASLTVAVAVLLVPVMGNYCISDALTGGGSVPLRYVVRAVLAILPAIATFLAIGIAFINGRDVA